MTTPSLSPESLLEHESFVSTLAHSLVRQEADAEDLIQETWIRALRTAPAQLTNPRGWLSRVLRNVLSERRRGTANRRAREDAASRPEALESVEESALRLESHSRLVDAVLGLGEPYRSVVLLTHFQGHSSKEVARRLDRSPGAVRVQLHRAHAQLREQLDAEYGDRSTWCALLAPSALRAAKQAAVVPALPLSTVMLVLATSAALTLALARVVTQRMWSHQVIPVAQEEARGPEMVPSSPEAKAGAAANDTSSGTQRLAVSEGVRVQLTGPLTSLAEIPVYALSVADLDPQAVDRIFPDRRMTPMELAERFGTRRISTADGSVSFPALQPGTVLMAGAPGHMGMLRDLPAGTESLQLPLEPCLDPRITVVDQNGQALSNVPVLLRIKWRSTGKYAGEETMAMAVASTGTQGQAARFLGVDTLLGDQQPQDLSYSVFLRMPGLRVSTELRGTRGKVEELTLEAPPTSRLELRIVDEEGAHLACQGQLEVREINTETPLNYTLSVSEGRCFLDWLAPGTELKLRLSIPGRGLKWEIELRAPHSPGKTVQRDLQIPSLPQLRGSLVSDGKPFADSPITVLLGLPGDLHTERIGTVTDAQGGFQVALAPKYQRPDRLGFVVAGSGILASLAAEIPPGPARGGHVGTLSIDPFCGRITGQVLDPDGAGLAGVELRLPRKLGGPIRLGETGAEGEFEYVGLFDEHGIIEVTHPEFVLAKVYWSSEKGCHLIVQLTAGGSIAGQVEPDSNLYLRLQDGSGRNVRQHWGDGSFEWAGLTTGTYRLEALHQAQVVYCVEDIQVRAGVRCTDPRLANISIAGQLEEWLVRVTDQQGRALPARVEALEGGRRLAYGQADRQNGEARLLLPYGSTPTLWVEHPGYRSQQSPHPNQQSVVVLEPGLTVELHTQQLQPLKKGKRSVFLSLRQEASHGPAGASNRVSLPRSLTTDGRATVIFPGPGRYVLHRSIQTPAGEVMMATTATPVPGDWSLEVQEADAGGSLTLELPLDLFE